MEPNTTAGPLRFLSGDRPVWQRLLIWLGIAFVLFNTVGIAAFFVLENNMGTFARLALVAVTLALPLWKGHGLNILRTWGNPATASFTRRDDPATGGYLFTVQPARAARMPALPLFGVGLLLLLVFLLSGSFWAYVIALVFLGVGASFVLPGARERQPVTVSVSGHGLQSGDIGMPLAAIADLRVEQSGLVVEPDSPMPRPNGAVPISSMLGRFMGRRQAARGYAVTLRADGESRMERIAGGLTEACAESLQSDLRKAVDAFRSQ